MIFLFFWTDHTGDGKIDGIAFAINDKIFYHPRQFENFVDQNKKIEKIDLYFIQSKKRETSSFGKKDFEKFSEGLELFVGTKDKTADPKPSESILVWKRLWINSIVEKIKRLNKNERPKVYIHLYYAQWRKKPEQYEFTDLEKDLRSKFINEAGVTDVKFHWADGEFLRKNYIANGKRKDSEESINQNSVKKVRKVFLRLTNNRTDKTVFCYVYDGNSSNIENKMSA